MRLDKVRKGLMLLVSMLAIVGLVGLTQGNTASATTEPNDEIHSSFGDVATEMWLYWHGSDTAVSYGLTTSYGSSATGVATSIIPVDISGPFYQVKITGLTAGTTYHYKIGSSGLDHTFQTAPTGDFVWDDIGDTGSTFWDSRAPAICNKTWMPDVWTQVASEHPAFVTHGGDISYANECGQGSVHALWNDIMPVSTQAAFQFSWGNHEYGNPPIDAPPGTPRDSMANYKGRYMMSNPQTVPNDTAGQVQNPGCPSPTNPLVNGCQGDDWGYFTAGHVLYISYPEPWPNAYSDWTTKAGALMSAAESDANIYFIVTYGHRPAYSSQTNNGAWQDLTDAVTALAQQYSPTARTDGKYVLNVGHHVHGGEVFSPQNGVVNITNGGGGTEEAGIITKLPESLWVTNHLSHLRATVTGNTMKLDMICGPVFPPNPAKDPCTKDDILYTQTLVGYQATSPQPIIATTIDDGVTSAKIGTTLTYTTTVKNIQRGGPNALSLGLRVNIPSNMTVISAPGAITNGTPPAINLNWSLGNLAPGASVTKTFQLRLDSGTVGDTFTVPALVHTTADTSCSTPGSICSVSDTDTIASLVKEYITNQSVETDQIGWTGKYNTASVITRVMSSCYDGSWCLQMQNSAGTTGAAGVIAQPYPVMDTVAGSNFTGTAWIRAQSVGQTIVLKLRETTTGGSTVGTGSQTLTAIDTAWHQYTVPYTIIGDHNQLTMIAYGTNLAPSAWFNMDFMSLIGPNI